MFKGIGRQATHVALIALLWTLLFEFNETVFAGAQLSLITNLLFLPALLRPLAVLLFGGAGVLGLFLGALVTFPLESLSGLSLVVVAAASSVPAWIAVAIMRRRQRFAAQLSDDLSGLEFNTIVIIALLCSALNAAAHYWLFSDALTAVDRSARSQELGRQRGCRGVMKTERRSLAPRYNGYWKIHRLW